MNIDLTDKSKWADGFMLRNGECARVVHRLNDGTIAVVTLRCDGTEYIGTRYADGRLSRIGESPLDLIPRPERHSGFIVFERLPSGGVTGTTYAWTVPPNINGWPEVIAVVPYSFTEGSGLEGAK